MIELLVATAVFAVLMTLLLSIVSQTTRLWQQSENQKVRRQNARVLLEIMTRDLESALFPLDRTNARSMQFLLNPAEAPLHRDAAFWQAVVPGQSAKGDVFEVGYFVQWTNDAHNRPRSALCRYSVPASNTDTIFYNPSAPWLTAQKLVTYAPGLGDTNNFKGVLAENVIGLWITLYGEDGSTNGLGAPYDSRTASARPSSAEVAFVLLDANIANRLQSMAPITNNISSTPEALVASLPDDMRAATQIFRARARFETAP